MQTVKIVSRPLQRWATLAAVGQRAGLPQRGAIGFYADVVAKFGERAVNRFDAISPMRRALGLSVPIVPIFRGS